MRSAREARERSCRGDRRIGSEVAGVLFMVCLGDGDKEEGFGRWNLLGFFFAKATPSVHFEEHAKKTTIYMGSVFSEEVKVQYPLRKLNSGLF